MPNKHRLDKNVLSLGLVSFFNDISSEMIYPLLPIFLSTIIGASTAFIGLVEGIAETTASILKVFSGWLSDRWRRRKPIVLWGYELPLISRPFFNVATSGWHVLLIRFFDRAGKGIRTSPRDALLADSSLAEKRGLAFGFQRAMDHLGAALGPLLAFAILPLLDNNLRLLFLFSFFPALIAVFIVIFLVKEKLPPEAKADKKMFLSLKPFSREFKVFVFILAIFALGNSSDAFLILRGKELGIKIGVIPILWFWHNVVASISSTPGGFLSDKIGRRKTILLGFYGDLRPVLWPE